MRIDKKTLNASPFIGVFGILTDSVFLAPKTILSKEIRGLQELVGVEVFKASIADSPLLGVLGIGVKDKIALSELAREEELECLQEIGLKAKRISGVTALGNLACITEKGGIVSPILSREQALELESFFGVKMVVSKIAGLDLVGASVVATPKGFIVHPQANSEEFKALKSALRVNGMPTTANYGDRFVGNSVLANSNAVIVGLNTTSHELIRIEEAFHG